MENNKSFNTKQMNWKEIKETFPKAFKYLLNWWSDAISTDFSKAYSSNFNDDYIDLFIPTRDLYDFFDDNNLNIRILPEYYYNGINWNWQVLWHKPTKHEHDGIWMAQCDGTALYGDNHEYPTRTEAETEAFEKAFEILETKLSAQVK